MKNVTVKLEEALVRAARHEAVDAGQSLSGWLAELIRERLGRSGVATTVAQVMGLDRSAANSELAAFEEARRRALDFLDHPVALEGESSRDALDRGDRPRGS